MNKKVILITGASKGFGRIWTEALLSAGHKVVATARDIRDIKDLENKYGSDVHTLPLDVTDKDACFKVTKEAFDYFGQIDVLINNAGIGHFDAIEQTSEKEARQQMETNFFGTLWMTQAVIPYMRAQQKGHIIQVSSFLGLVTVPIFGLYSASKFAVEGLSETLAFELAPFNIRITLLEPSLYQTNWWSSTSKNNPASIDTYSSIKEGVINSISPDVFGDPKATVAPLLDLLNSAEPPFRLLLGQMAYSFVTETYKNKMEGIEGLKEISLAAQGN